ncbi:MAG: tRNA (guanosine(46)-N7)-methyltransferase TrmB [Erysipelotrichaceae bacterium]|nr:tRNA (guanosine(46)-N7)-methyltransferase TrmB [Erysipelotrichaceae bacterium]
MRMRKKPWAEPFLAEHNDVVLDDPSQMKGKWKEALHTDELHVEIGMGKGDYVNQMAALNPSWGWVGIERDRSAAAVSARKLVEEPKANVLMIAKDAQAIEEWFAPKEIDVIHLNFSDPWPQNGYRKRRLSHAGFLAKYAGLLNDGGRIIMKTDNSGLFEFSLKEFTHNGYEIEQVWVDFRREEHPEDVITEYETRFLELGQPIYRAIFVRK